jgi:hypothetical protein
MKNRPALRAALAPLALLGGMVVLAGCSGGARAIPGGAGQSPSGGPGVVLVDIAYLNHGPVLDVLDHVNRVLAKYGDRLKVSRYDLDTPTGDTFAKAKRLTGHTPLAIFINGSMDVTLNGHRVRFYSFPQGEGTGMVAEGAWTIDMLDAALAQATGGRR